MKAVVAFLCTWLSQPYVWLAIFALGAAIASLFAAHGQQKETRELLNQVTGGDSFVYLQPLRKGGNVRYFVRSAGDHPAFDVVVRVEEIGDVLGPRLEGKRKRALVFGPTSIGSTTLRRGSGYDWTYERCDEEGHPWPLVFEEPPQDTSSPKEFRIEVAARNGIIIQRIQIRPVGDRWHTETTLLQWSHRKSLKGRLPGDFKEAQDQPENPPEVYDDGQ